MYSYKWISNILLTNIKLYKQTRKVNPWDYATFKNISDELSESLACFGPVAASLRAKSEVAKAEREKYYEERRIFWHDTLGEKRGNATIITAKATIDSHEMKLKEIEANKAWYEAKEILERVDQYLNSISRRLKESKYDQDGNIEN